MRSLASSPRLLGGHPEFFRRTTAFLVIGSLLFGNAFVAAEGTSTGCANLMTVCVLDPNECHDPELPATVEVPRDQPCPSGYVNLNPFQPMGGNVERTVEDLSLPASVGKFPLSWKRIGHSRFNPSTGTLFGEGHGWRHGYQWQMVELERTAGGTIRKGIYYPNGAFYEFVKGTGVNYTSTSSCPDRLYVTNVPGQESLTLVRSSGERIRFERFLEQDGSPYFLLSDITDPQGQNYHFTHNASRRLTLVTEPAGRYLRINYQQITANQSRFKTLALLPSVPTDNQWSELPVTDPTPYRYLRYSSPSLGYCDVAEIEFYDENGVLLTGTPIGSSPAGAAGQEFDKAFDGNAATFFHYSSRSYGYTGLDLGEGNARRISKVRYYPRAGYASRMFSAGTNKAKFEGSNEAPATLTLIANVESSDGRRVDYEYGTMHDTVFAHDWVTLTGVNYGDDTSASYEYTQLWPGVAPLMTAASDPRYSGAASRMRYEYWQDAQVIGSLKAERSYDTNTPLVTLEGIGEVDSKVTFSDGRTQTFKWPVTALNRVTEKVDGTGGKTRYAYSSSGRGYLASETDPRGATTTYTRDAQGRPLTVTYPGGATKQWTWDAGGRMLTYTDELNRTTTITRDTKGQSTRIDYPDGSYEGFTYNNWGQVLTSRARNGGVTTNAYDNRGLLTSRTDALNGVTSFTYDQYDRIASKTDTGNHTTQFEYTERGLLLKTTHPDANTVSNTYDEFGNVVSTINELGKAWVSEYDEFNRRISLTDPLNRTTYWVYEGLTPGCCGGGGNGAEGGPSQVILPSGKTTVMTYDKEGRKRSETLGVGTADEATTTFTYDGSGNLTAVTNPLGCTIRLEYDLRNRRTALIDPMGRRTEWTYDAAGNQLTETRPDGGIASMTYDVMNRRITQTDALNQTTTLAYGGTGAGTFGDNLVTLTDAKNNVTSFTYDLAGRRTRKTYADASHEDSTYDAAGNLLTHTTPAGAVLTVTSDNRNRPTLRDWSDATPDVSLTYDAAGRVLTMTSSVSALSYTYDDANQLLSETQDLQSPVNLPPMTASYSYNADGNRQGLGYPDGGTQVSYTYTGRNQLKDVIADGPPPMASYAYDLAGKRVSKTLENGTSTTYLYDVAGQLLQIEHRNSAGVLASFDYGYDVAGRRTSRTESQGAQAVGSDLYGYDAINQLTGVSYGLAGGFPWSLKVNFQPSGTPVPTGYTPDFGQLFGNRGNGYSYGWSIDNTAQTRDRNQAADQRYDTLNHMQKPGLIATWEVAVPNGSYRVRAVAGDATAYDSVFQLTVEGQVILAGTPSSAQRWIEGTGQVTVSDGRLSLSNGPQAVHNKICFLEITKVGETSGAAGRTTAYSYDALGNRTTMVADADGNGPVAPETTPYSANNLNQYTAIDALAAPQYDANGNMITVQHHPGGPVWTYGYDAQNRIVSVMGSNGTTAAMAYDPKNRCVSRNITAGGVTNTLLFIWDEWGLIEERSTTGAVLANYYHGNDIDEILANTTGSGVRFHHHDALGSVIALSDDTGQCIERVRYDVYGSPTFVDAAGQPATNSAAGNRFLYTGREWIQEVDLSDHRNRYYLPQLGIWLSRDRLLAAEVLQGPNLYCYVGNRVPTDSDPLGLNPAAMAAAVADRIAGAFIGCLASVSASVVYKAAFHTGQAMKGCHGSANSQSANKTFRDQLIGENALPDAVECCLMGAGGGAIGGTAPAIVGGAVAQASAIFGGLAAGLALPCR